MATLPRLQPEHFYDLVVEVAIIRPGPIVGQMVHPYLDRRRGREPVTYAHPDARADPQAHARRAALPGAAAAHGHGGGRLHRRRGRGAAPRHGLQALGGAHARDRGAPARRHGARTASAARRRTTIVKSITSFALYGFPESHAASFALLAYASAYLRAPPPRRLHLRAAQQLADGLLPPGDAGEGRAAPRPARAAGGCDASRSGSARWSPWPGARAVRPQGPGGAVRSPSASASATSPACARRPASASRGRAPRRRSPRSTTSPTAPVCATTSSKRWPTPAPSPASGSPAAMPCGRPRRCPATRCSVGRRAHRWRRLPCRRCRTSTAHSPTTRPSASPPVDTS